MTAREPLRDGVRHAARAASCSMLELEGADGIVGYGEAAPLEPYDGVGSTRCAHALEALRAACCASARRPGGGTALLDACRDAADLPQALAAIDLALWDRAGRRAGPPVCRAARDRPARRRCRSTRRSAPRTARGAAARRPRAAADGLRLREGQGRHRRRRRAGRGGARGGRAADGDPARRQRRLGRRGGGRAIEALAPAGLELVEEPVHGVAAMREVRERVAARIAIDETIGESRRAGGRRRRRGLPEDLPRCGGIIGAARRRPRWCAPPAPRSTWPRRYDGPLGIAAALHCAAALRARAAAAGWRRWACSTSTTRCRRSTGRSPCRRVRAWASSRTWAEAGDSVGAATARPGASRGRPWPAPGTTTAPRRAAAPRAARRTRGTSIALADDDRRRHRQLAEAIPQRRHRARAEAAQRRGERAAGVARDVARASAADLGRVAGEQRLAATSGRRTRRSSRVSMNRASCSSAARSRGTRRDASAIPAVVATRISRSTRSGAAARRAARCARPSSSRTSAKRVARDEATTSCAQCCERDRPRARGAAPWPRMSGASAR